jgi:hypothetical protein
MKTCLHGLPKFVFTDGVARKSFLWDTTLFSPLKVNWHFGERTHLHLQGRRINQSREQHEAGSNQSSAWLILGPWRWRLHNTAKCWLTFNALHDVIPHKIELFITTVERTSKSTYMLKFKRFKVIFTYLPTVFKIQYILYASKFLLLMFGTFPSFLSFVPSPPPQSGGQGWCLACPYPPPEASMHASSHKTIGKVVVL